MESLAALSLACNVLQIIQFCGQTVRTCKQIYEDKSPTSNVDDQCKNLQTLSSKVKVSLASTGNAQSLGTRATSPGSDQQLLSLANKLMTLANDLNTELVKFRPSSRDSKLRKLAKGVKYQWSGKGRIDGLHSSLKSLENTFQSFVLVDLRQIACTLHEKDFRILDQQTQNFASKLAAGFTRTDELIRNESALTRDLIVDQCDDLRTDLGSTLDKARIEIATESRNLQGLMDQEFDEIKKARIHDQTREKINRLLQSLAVPDINARYNSITPSHNTTFEWIFDATSVSSQSLNATAPKDGRREHSLAFSKWLSSNGSLFWISGKPGSGKSTLMKFLLEHPRTRDLLGEHDASTLILHHFIWNAGSYSQRSPQSLIASILHQLFSHRAEVAHALIEENGLQQKLMHSDWSQESLEAVLFKALLRVQSSTCIFIDGLDEIDQAEGDGLYKLLALIHRLRSLQNVRICASSRPEVQIQQQFETWPAMRLQDLTQPDIRAYIVDNLALEWKKASFIRRSHETMSSLTGIMLEKSDGVFLWVRLVVSSIRNGLIKYDNWEMLLERIQALPSKMNELYKNMWERLNDDKEIYRAESALYFKLFLLRSLDRNFDPSTNTVLGMLIASDRSVQMSLLGGGATVSEQDMNRKCYTFQYQLMSRCAGFIEVQNDVEETKVSHASIQFIHKSVADFLLDTLDGQSLLQSDKTTVPELFVCSFLSFLVYDVLLHNYGTDNGLWWTISDLITICQRLKVQGPGASGDLCYRLSLDLIERTVKRIPEWPVSKLDFVLIGAELGLCDYIKMQVQDKPPPQGLSRCAWKSLLVGHASMGPRVVLEHMRERNFELISWLLDEGADPNHEICDIRLPGKTPFHCFLLTLEGVEITGNDPPRAWLRVLSHFVGRGADLNAPLLMQQYVIGGASFFDFSRFPYYSFYLENSLHRLKDEETEDEETEDEETEDEETEDEETEDEETEHRNIGTIEGEELHNETTGRETLGDENSVASDLGDDELGDGTWSLHKPDKKEDHANYVVNLFVELPRAGLDFLERLTPFLEDTECEGIDVKNIKDLHSTNATTQTRVRLMTRISSEWPPPRARTHISSFSAKTVALEEAFDDLITKTKSRDAQKRLNDAYCKSTSPEMNAQETLDWMIENGFLAKDLRYCEDPLDVFMGRDYLRKQDLPRREGFSGVDFSYHEEYSTLMKALAQFRKDQNGGRDFLDYCIRINS